MPLLTARQLHVNRQPSCTRQCRCGGTWAPRPMCVALLAPRSCFRRSSSWNRYTGEVDTGWSGKHWQSAAWGAWTRPLWAGRRRFVTSWFVYPCKARLRPPCTLRTQAHTLGGLTTKQMAGPEAQELIAAMGGVRILVQMCSVPQPEEVRAMSPDTLLLLYLFRSSAPMFGKALRERFCRTQVY